MFVKDRGQEAGEGGPCNVGNKVNAGAFHVSKKWAEAGAAGGNRGRGMGGNWNFVNVERGGDQLRFRGKQAGC